MSDAAWGLDAAPPDHGDVLTPDQEVAAVVPQTFSPNAAEAALSAYQAPPPPPQQPGPSGAAPSPSGGSFGGGSWQAMGEQAAQNYIRHRESSGNYDVVHYGPNVKYRLQPPAPPTSMTLGQVYDFQRRLLQVPGNDDSSATGAYQWVSGTLKNVGHQMFGDNWRNVPFSRNTQDAMFHHVYSQGPAATAQAWGPAPGGHAAVHAAVSGSSPIQQAAYQPHPDQAWGTEAGPAVGNGPQPTADQAWGMDAGPANHGAPQQQPAAPDEGIVSQAWDATKNAWTKGEQSLESGLAGAGASAIRAVGELGDVLSPAANSYLAAQTGNTDVIMQTEAKRPALEQSNVGYQYAKQAAAPLETYANQVRPKDPNLAERILEGAGSMIPAMGAMAINPLAGAGMFAGQGYDQTYQDALAHGASEQQAREAGAENAGIQGTIGLLPLGKLTEPFVEGIAGAKGVAARLAARGGTNAAMVGGMQTGSNVVAQQYDPNRPLFQGVPSAMLEGALAGEVVHGATHVGTVAHEAILPRVWDRLPESVQDWYRQRSYIDPKLAVPPPVPGNQNEDGAAGIVAGMPATDAITRYRADGAPIASDALQAHADAAGVAHAPDVTYDKLMADTVDHEAKTQEPDNATITEHEHETNRLLTPNEFGALNAIDEGRAGPEQAKSGSAFPVFETGARAAGPEPVGERAAHSTDGGEGARGAAEVAALAPDYRFGPHDTAVTPSGKEVPVQYAVVDAGQLTASHDASGMVNPAYPAQLQPRDRARGTSEVQIAQMAAGLDPRLLMGAVKASDGAPIVSPQGVVESGNGRTLAIRAAYQRFPDAAQRYREAIAAQGFDVSDMQTPMLVRVRTGQMSPAEVEAFTREANARDTLAYSATEQAQADARSLPDAALALYRGGDIDAAGNRDFVKAFLTHAVPAGEHGAMIAADGTLSKQAITRIHAALLAKAYGDADLIANIVESTDTNIKAIGGALTDVAGMWAKLREGVQDGRVAPEMDVTANLLDAVHMIDNARKGSTPTEIALRDALNQGNMFSGDTVDPITEDMLRMMFNDEMFKRPTGRDRLAEALRTYVEQASQVGSGPDLFGGATKATPHDILALAKGKANGPEQTDLLAGVRGASEVAGLSGENSDNGGGEVLPAEVRPEVKGAAEVAAAHAETGQPITTGASGAGSDIAGGRATPSPEAATREGGEGSVDHAKMREGMPSDIAGDVYVMEGPNGEDSGWRMSRDGAGRIVEWNSRDGKLIVDGRERKHPVDINGFADAVRAGRKPDEEGSVKGAADVAAAHEPVRGAADVAMLQDAGEKIGGARKDQWAERGLRLSDLEGMNEGEAYQHVTKDQVWPKPNYAKMVEDGMRPEVAAAIKLIRDRLGARPRDDSAQGRRDYVTMLGHVREVLEAAQSLDDIKAANHTLMYDRTGLAQRGNGEDQKAARQLLFSVAKGRSISFDLGYSDLQKIRKMAEEGWPTAEAQPWKRRFEVRPASRDTFVVRAKGAGKRLPGEYASREDAETAAAKAYDDMKATDGEKVPPSRPHLDTIQREGVDLRGGKDVTGDDFIRDLGFRGVEFGNWVASDERQRSINMAYDALHDLAGVIGVPPKAMSLNGQLGIAFGARGKGSALAHYEPGKLVINLTKLSGAGALAHEWGHALDHYFGTLNEAETTRGAPKGASGWYDRARNLAGTLKNLRPEMAQRFDDLMGAIFHRDQTKAEQVRDTELAIDRLKAAVATQKERMAEAKARPQDRASAKFIKDSATWIAANEGTLVRLGQRLADQTGSEQPLIARKVDSSYYNQAKALSGKASDKGYWARPTEMFARAFESYVFDKIKADQGASDYLVHGVEPERYAEGYKGNPYPAGEDRARINAAFDALFSEMRHEESDKGIALSSRTEGQPEPARSFDATQAKALADDLHARLKGILGDKVALRIRNSMAELGGAQGLWWKDRRVIEVALDAKDDHSFVLDHEVLHAMRALGMIPEPDWAIAAKAARRMPEIWNSVNLRYADQSVPVRVEEAVADLHARFQRGDFSPKGPLERALVRIIKVLSAIRNAFRGQGFTSTRTFREVFGDVGKGQLSVPDSSRLRSVEATPLHDQANGLVGNAHLLANLSESSTFRQHGLRALDVPTQRMVLDAVFAMGQHPQVLDAIIKGLPIDVVNMLAARQLTPEMAFHDKAMLSDLLAVGGDNAVSILVDVADAAKRMIADGVTEHPDTLSPHGGPFGDHASAMGANIEHPKLISDRTTNATFDDKNAQIVAKESRPSEDDRFARDAEEGSQGFGGGRGPRGYGDMPPPPKTGPAAIINRLLGHGIDSVGAKLIGKAHDALPDPVLDILHEMQMAVSPMGAGSPRAQAEAKDFANANRNAAYQWGEVRKFLQKTFTPDDKRLMWEAADEHGVLLRQGLAPDAIGPHQGMNRLAPNVRGVVEELQARADAAFTTAQDLGMVTGDGLESYVPRMVVQMTAAGPTARMKASPRQAKRGGNLSTTTGQLRQRKYETVAETEAAAKQAFGDGAMVVRDIETLAIATQRLEQAIAGRTLVDKIKAMSKDAMGGELVTEGKPDNADAYFTMDHPALTKWGPRIENGKVVLKADGEPVMDATPLWISKEFEGPLKAVLSSPTSALVRTLGELKAKQMSVIMYSPMMHNAVIWGKAFPVDPVGMLVMKPYRDGSGVRGDPALMSEAIKDGMDPIGKRYFNQDIAGIASGEGLDMVPGRGWLARMLGGTTDLASKEAGEAVRRAVDKAGDVWHNTFLWDRIADLQAGIWSNLKTKFLKDGMDQATAGRLAAHFANRYAGALPMEGLSKTSRTMANIFLFSRSFTLGNLAAFKDLTAGLPSDVRAQIERDSGPLMREMAQGATRRKAAGMLFMEVAMAKVALSLAAGAIAFVAGTPIQWPWQNEENYKDRFLIEHDSNHTAWYGRLPVGKVQEDQWGWLLSPRQTLIKKLSGYGRLMYGVAANDRGFGKPMFEPGPTTPKTVAHDIYNVVTSFLGGMVPEGQLQAAHDLYTGETNNRAMTALQTFLPVTGITISHGYPGGEAKGDLAAFNKQVEFDLGEQMPQISRKIIGGDIQGAREQMTAIGIDPRHQMAIILSTKNPGRLSRGQLRNFMIGSTPEQEAQFREDQTRAVAP